jgi:hypothetical protein
MQQALFLSMACRMPLAVLHLYAILESEGTAHQSSNLLYCRAEGHSDDQIEVPK